MAGLWSALREEWRASVDEFKTKGAVGALWDAALDTKDLLVDAGGLVVDGAQVALYGKSASARPALRLQEGAAPQPGSQAQLELEDGSTEDVEVVGVDMVSQPPRASVRRSATSGETIVVPLLNPLEEEKEGAGGVILPAGQWLVDAIREEVTQTVEDFREKGAVGALKDAALDVVDIAKDGANTALDIAKDVAPTVVDAAKDSANTLVDIAQDGATTAYSAAQSLAVQGGLIDNSPAVPPEALEDPFALPEEDNESEAKNVVPSLKKGLEKMGGLNLPQAGGDAECFSIATARGEPPAQPQFKGRKSGGGDAAETVGEANESDSDSASEKDEELID